MSVTELLLFLIPFFPFIFFDVFCLSLYDRFDSFLMFRIFVNLVPYVEGGEFFVSRDLRGFFVREFLSFGLAVAPVFQESAFVKMVKCFLELLFDEKFPAEPLSFCFFICRKGRDFKEFLNTEHLFSSLDDVVVD